MSLPVDVHLRMVGAAWPPRTVASGMITIGAKVSHATQPRPELA
jgi:hypothetical protein